ncbi:hypothetical protein [Seonamhaeicola sp.]|uniref:hypothetical protein n=1 Tax=Seonamhaeicola sp. TaxID=1912245 RepID=UPI00262D0ABF|nr:hypothetical protein [Seonamhaeicola sp.]
MEIKEDILIMNYTYNWTQNEYMENTEVYERYINWVSGEFDLYQKQESKALKVYFPNGWFVIRRLNKSNEGFVMEIKVEGKSKLACEQVKLRLKSIYDHVKYFQNLKNNI